MASRIPPGYQECRNHLCDNLFALKDRHRVCVLCLGEGHARESLLSPESCVECRPFSAAQLQTRYRMAKAAPKPVHSEEEDEPGPSSGRSSRGSCYAGVGDVSMGHYHPDDSEDDDAACSSMGLQRRDRPLFLRPPGRVATFGDVDFSEFEPRSHGTTSRQLSVASMATAADDEDVEDIEDAATANATANQNQAAVSAPAEPAAPAKIKEKHPFTVTLEMAVELCGLEWPQEERKGKAPSHALNIAFEGCETVPEPPAPNKRLPVARGFKEALWTTWMDHKDPPTMGFSLETAGLTELGTRSIPPMDPVLAQSFFDGAAKAPGQNPFVVSTKELGFTDFRDKRDSKGAERSYRYCGNAARSLNAAAISTGAMAAQLKKAKDRMQEEDVKCFNDLIQLSLRLNCYAIQWVGKAMEEAVTQERKRWLDQAKLQSGIGKDLKDSLQKLPVHPANLFEGGVEFLQSSMEALRSQKEMAAGVMAPPATPAAASTKSTRGKKKQAAPTTTPSPTASANKKNTTSSSSSSTSAKKGDPQKENEQHSSTTYKPNYKGRRGGYKGK